jgi:hypothetical protein
MLGDALVSEGITVVLPSQHKHYHPWVPPHWLPEHILVKVEDKLLKIVEAMVVDHDHLATSRLSSLPGDPGLEKYLIADKVFEVANELLSMDAA